LITAQALFPEAPDYHLVADFPVGHPSCFVDAACTSQANESATAFFRHWANLRYARQSTNLMRRAFERVGQLPALLVSLHLMRQPVLHATTRNVAPPSISASMRTKVSAKNLIAGRIRAGAAAGGASGRRLETTIVASGGTPGVVIPSITLHTERCRVAYHSLLLKSDPSEHVRLSKQDWPVFKRWERGGAFVDAQLDALSAALNGRQVDDELHHGCAAAWLCPKQKGGTATPSAPPRLMMSMFKAAPHWILRNEWMASWVLRHSAATLHDESGLRPMYYNASAGLVGSDWQTVTRGFFADFENREVKWYPGEKAELKAVFRGPELPFQFGYAQHGGLGVLHAAWRREVA